MQAFFANFPNKLTLNFPQNIVHQIFHEMSNILYIFSFSRFSADFPVNGFFRRFSAAVQDPQIFQISHVLETIRRFSASSFPDFPLYRIRRFSADFPLARFSASPPASQVFRTKKGLDFSSPVNVQYSITPSSVAVYLLPVSFSANFVIARN